MKAKIEFDYNEHCRPPQPYGRLLIEGQVRATSSADTFEEVERDLLEQARHMSALPEPPTAKEYEVQL